MAENDQPPAPPVGMQTSAPSAPAEIETIPAPAPAPAPERAEAPPLERKRAEIYDTLAAHLLEANGPAVEGGHPRVHEHLALAGVKDVVEHDPITEQLAMRPHWKERVLLAWWKAHGLERHSRISPQHFTAALHEALHGRI